MLNTHHSRSLPFSRRLGASRAATLASLATIALAFGCAADPVAETPDASGTTNTESGTLHASIGPEGGELVGAPGSPLAGVRLAIPAGALAAKTELTLRAVDEGTPLP